MFHHSTGRQFPPPTCVSRRFKSLDLCQGSMTNVSMLYGVFYGPEATNTKHGNIESPVYAYRRRTLWAQYSFEHTTYRRRCSILLSITVVAGVHSTHDLRVAQVTFKWPCGRCPTVCTPHLGPSERPFLPPPSPPPLSFQVCRLEPLPPLLLSSEPTPGWARPRLRFRRSRLLQRLCHELRLASSSGDGQ